MRVFKTRLFAEWANKEGVSDDILWSAIVEMEHGLIDASLGGNVYKKRIAMKDRGRRGGARTLIATRFKETAFFMYGFAKNVRTNISKKERKALKMLAQQLLAYSTSGLEKAMMVGEFFEVKVDEENNS